MDLVQTLAPAGLIQLQLSSETSSAASVGVQASAPADVEGKHRKKKGTAYMPGKATSAAVTAAQARPGG